MTREGAIRHRNPDPNLCPTSGTVELASFGNRAQAGSPASGHGVPFYRASAGPERLEWSGPPCPLVGGPSRGPGNLDATLGAIKVTAELASFGNPIEVESLANGHGGPFYRDSSGAKRVKWSGPPCPLADGPSRETGNLGLTPSPIKAKGELGSFGDLPHRLRSSTIALDRPTPTPARGQGILPAGRERREDATRPLDRPRRTSTGRAGSPPGHPSLARKPDPNSCPTRPSVALGSFGKRRPGETLALRTRLLGGVQSSRRGAGSSGWKSSGDVGLRKKGRGPGRMGARDIRRADRLDRALRVLR